MSLVRDPRHLPLRPAGLLRDADPALQERVQSPGIHPRHAGHVRILRRLPNKKHTRTIPRSGDQPFCGSADCCGHLDHPTSVPRTACRPRRCRLCMSRILEPAKEPPVKLAGLLELRRGGKKQRGNVAVARMREGCGPFVLFWLYRRRWQPGEPAFGFKRDLPKKDRCRYVWLRQFRGLYQRKMRTPLGASNPGPYHQRLCTTNPHQGTETSPHGANRSRSGTQ